MSQQNLCYVFHINSIMFHKCFQYNLKDDRLFLDVILEFLIVA